MFHAIGRAVARRGIWLIVAWLVLLGTVWRTAPEWNDVAKQGEFGFLPDYTASRQSQKLLNQAFPDDVIHRQIATRAKVIDCGRDYRVHCGRAERPTHHRDHEAISRKSELHTRLCARSRPIKANDLSPHRCAGHLSVGQRRASACDGARSRAARHHPRHKARAAVP